MKMHLERPIALLLVFSSILTSCANPTTLEEACTEVAVDPPWDTVTVEGYLLQDWCNEANDGQIMCMMRVDDGEHGLPVIIRTHTDRAWPLGIYPHLPYEPVRRLLCGEDEECSHGAERTRFRLRGECATYLARSMGLNRVLYADFDDIRPITSGVGLEAWVVWLVVAVVGIGTIAAFYRRTQKKGRARQIPSEPFAELTQETGKVQEISSEHSAELTQEEKQVLHLLSKGLANLEIADQLGISPVHASLTTSGLLEKFGADSKDELVNQARQKGYLPPT